MVSRVACVGSREVDKSMRNLLIHIGNYLVKKGYVVSSGNAHGADQLYAEGGSLFDPAKVELHLPWKGYNPENIVKGNVILVDGDNPRYQEVASRQHPAWSRLSRGARALHARNVGIVQGCCLVIALPNWKKPGGGGTGMALRLAKHFVIPALDLTQPEDLKRIQRRLYGQS